MIIIERNVDKIALLLTALFVASSAAGSANARSNFASPADPTAVDEEDTFDYNLFENPEKMRVILGDTSGWVNPHDKMGSPQRRQKAKQQFLNRQRQCQKQLADPSLRESDPISEDTASSETRAELYSQLRNRSTANGCTFCRLPTRLDNDDSGVKEEPVVVPTAAVQTAAAPTAAAASKSCDCDCKSLNRDLQSLFIAVASLEELAQQTETQSAQLEQRLSAMLASSIVIPINLLAGSAADALLGCLARLWASLVGPAQPALVLALATLAVLVLALVRLRLETARRDAFLSRNIVPPEECSPGYSPGWLRRLTSDDQVVCDRYYEKLLVDPVWQVNPLIVASDLLSRMFFHPLTFLGDYLGRFAQDFAKHQTFWSTFINLLFLVVLGGVILMFPFRVGIFLWVNYHGGQRDGGVGSSGSAGLAVPVH
ncbi:hypothetical protein ISCGN_021825 [Ixodes scapularis]